MKSTLTLTLIILLTIMGFQSNAQDVHFSQFWNTPLLQNPSFAGNSESSLRAIVNYRSQWSSVTSNPFKTFGASYDMRFSNRLRDNYMAGGISMYTDVAGASKMRTTLVNLSIAYHLKLQEQHYLSSGLQIGFNQKSISENDLRFDNQFDGEGHDASLSSNESLTNIAELQPTVSAGLTYMWSNVFGRTTSRSAQAEKNIKIGLALHHFNNPNFHFVQKEKLGLKYIGSFEGSFATPSTPWSIQPAAFVAIQKKATDFVFGSLFKYSLKQGSQLTAFNKQASFAFGGYYRFKDAVIPTVQVQWASFVMAFNYDVNLSELSGLSKGKGGFEISLKYLSLGSTLKKRSRARFF